MDVSSQASAHALVDTTPPDYLLSLPMLQPDGVTDTLHGYQLA